MIFIHVGLRKAGSSSLQKFLSINREPLRTLGVDFPKVGAFHDEGWMHHANIAHELSGRRRFDPKFGSIDDLAAYWRGSTASKLLISSEMLETCNTREAAGLIAALRRETEPAQVYIVLRDLVELVPSIYSQQVKTGRSTRHFDRFFDDLMRNDRVDVSRAVDRWAAACGWSNLTVRLLDRRCLRNGDLMDDCLAAIGLNASAAQCLERPADINRSPGWRVTEAVRALHTGRHGLPRGHPLARMNPDDRERNQAIALAAFDRGDRLGWNAERGHYLTRAQAALCVDIHTKAMATVNRSLAEALPLPAGLDERGFVGRRGAAPSIERISGAELRAFYDLLGEAISEANFVTGGASA